VSITDADPTAMFRTRPFGFDKEQVTACLQQASSEYARALEQITWLTKELQAAEEASKDRARQEMPASQIAGVLASANRVAEDMKTQAEQAAAALRREAQEDARQIRSQAEADATALVGTASARRQDLQAEIEDMLARREAVQIALDRAAERLVEIANDMRGAVRAEPTDDVSIEPASSRT
jgi:cell division septum initiation protein DivIVA